MLPSMSMEATEQDNAQSVAKAQREQTGFKRDALGRILPGSAPPAHAWKPGQSGNPNGRGLEAELKRMLETEASERFPGLTKRQAIAHAALQVAQDPNHPAFGVAQKLVWERADGAVAKTLRIEGELPLKVVVRGDRD